MGGTQRCGMPPEYWYHTRWKLADLQDASIDFSIKDAAGIMEGEGILSVDEVGDGRMRVRIIATNTLDRTQRGPIILLTEQRANAIEPHPDRLHWKYRLRE
ncbi:MAG: hypothetical protein ABJF10_23360 [Chthoniobacter sp.]|uniref:hypothetical protein n=1 Tax=Chthoniobacter sp. TaxID=2510640 RepID=UPI0032ADB733